MSMLSSSQTSTKEPVKVKASRKKQAEEEFKLIKNLAVSISALEKEKPRRQS
jgi:hypothetical protein